MVLALPTTRLAVMGPAGKEFVYKDELRKLRAEAAKRGDDDGGRAWLKAGEAELSLRYERELMNPREALSLGSISQLVMPDELRSVLGRNLLMFLRHYTPAPFSSVQREFH